METHGYIVIPTDELALSLNSRAHWSRRAEANRSLREVAYFKAKEAELPRLRRGAVVVEFYLPDRRRRDLDNLLAACKPAIDGLVAAHVFEDDSINHITRITASYVGQKTPGEVVLTVYGEEMEIEVE